MTDFDFSIGFVCGLIVTILAVVFAAMFCDTPTALDVYRGETTLRITYENGIPTDTVVVYKQQNRQ